jgi:hypothetical protein
MALSLTVKPFIAAPDLSWWQRINKVWWLQRIPMALLALPSAYGVGAFASEHLPWPFNWFAGAAFESAYIGAIALADQQSDVKDQVTTLLWFLVNLFAVVCSALSSVLFFAGGHYSDITPEAVTHGVPLAVLGFFYGLLLHRMASKAAQAVAEAGTEVECPNCHRMLVVKAGGNPAATLNGHKTHCKMP